MQTATVLRPISAVVPFATEADRVPSLSKREPIKLIATSRDAICPKRANDTDMGADLAVPDAARYLISNFLSEGGKPHKVDFGLVLHPDSYSQVSGLMLCLRSSMANKGLLLANGVGLIDVDYPGHLAKDRSSVYGICALVHNLGETMEANSGDRLAQLVVYDQFGRLTRPEFEIVSYMTDASSFDRFLASRKATRKGGFGSSGV